MIGRRTKSITDKMREEMLAVDNEPVFRTPTNFKKVLSTGSTLLDLAISGDLAEMGGIPGGILIEIAGPPGSGKTTLLAEIVGSCIHHGGTCSLADPEGRLSLEYLEEFGVPLEMEKYWRPDTVTELFSYFQEWKSSLEQTNSINVFGADSLAALSTTMEMEGEDKRGQRRAKEFSEGLRKTCRMIAEKNILMVCTNQIREGNTGHITPGGWAVPFYSSLRISINPSFPKSKIEKVAKVGSKEVKQVVGIYSSVKVVKSSIGIPFRTANVSIVFGHGVDDTRDSLQYLKDMKSLKAYPAVNKDFHAIDRAIQYIEENGLEKELRNEVRTLWREIDSKFKTTRKKKERW